MTDKNWNPDDYKFEFADILPYSGDLVSMPFPHKVEKLRLFFVGEIIGEMRRCLDANAELAGLLLSLSAVEYLAGYYAGHQSKPEDFRAFLTRYFAAEYKLYVDDIYRHLRNGLVHNLVIRNPWQGQGLGFTIQNSSPNHLQIDKDGKIEFSVSHFCEDIRRAFWMYSHDLIMRSSTYPDLVKKFQQRFNKLQGQGAFMERIP